MSKKTNMDGLGNLLIQEIIEQGMMNIQSPDPDKEHVFVWNANSAEQLECVVSNFLSPPIETPPK